MARTSMGNVVEDLTTLSNLKKEEYAQTFCEGNEDLKKLLLKMWNNNIQTYASCAGHTIEEAKNANGMVSNPNPYIYFEVGTLTEKQQQKLFKNLIMISKNLGLIEDFELILDNYMGFEKHGLTIRLRNSEYSYRALNDLFDDVLKNESVVDKVKKFLIKKDKNDGLSEEELLFVNSLLELNAVNFTEYLEGAKNLKDEEKICAISFNYDRKKGTFISVTDGLKTSVVVVSNEVGNYWVQVAEGMYSKDPHKEGTFYTLKNGDIKEVEESEFGELKEFSDLRQLNFSTVFYKGAVNNVMGEVNRVISLKNSNEI